MVTKVTKPTNSIRQRASAIKQKQNILKQKEVIAPIKKKIIPKKIIKPIAKTIPKKAINATPIKITKKIAKPIMKIIPKKVIKPITSIPQKKTYGDIEEKLIENFISLQKVMVNLSVKFDGLSNQISKLLQLFEISAKALAEKDFNQEKQMGYTKNVSDKVTNLFEQNKVIARGLTLLHEKMFGEEIPSPPQQPLIPNPLPQRMPLPSRPQQQMLRGPPQQGPPIRRNLPPPQRGPPQQGPSQSTEAGYEKSLSNPNPQQQFKKLPDPTGQSV